MSKTEKNNHLVEIPLGQLKPHPRNKELYQPRTRSQLEELAQDMAKNGLTEPIEVLPDGTIISGHGRVDAAKLLGWKTVRCWVRRDLEEAGPEAVEARLIETNLHRRQLS